MDDFLKHANSLSAIETALKYEIDTYAVHQLKMILENMSKCIYHLDMQNRILFEMLKEMKTE